MDVWTAVGLFQIVVAPHKTLRWEMQDKHYPRLYRFLRPDEGNSQLGSAAETWVNCEAVVRVPRSQKETFTPVPAPRLEPSTSRAGTLRQAAAPNAEQATDI
jgi:hypothetical protein